jgi:hypothetical protein
LQNTTKTSTLRLGLQHRHCRIKHYKVRAYYQAERPPTGGGILIPGQRNRRKKTHTGIIKETVTRVETAKNGEVVVMTAVCDWTEAGDGMDAGEHCSGVILLSGKYGKCDERDGWYVHPKDTEQD